MWDVRVCAACLAIDVRMHSMSAASLLEPYRLLTGIEWESEGMPQKLCWECAALVHKFNMFRRKCERASLLLQDIYNQHDEVSEENVLRVNRDQHNLISSYTVCPIQVYNLSRLKIKDKKSKAKNIKHSQTDNAPMETLVKLENNIIKKEEIPIEIKSESNKTERIDDVIVEEGCSQAVQLESTQKIKRIRKKTRWSKPKEKRETKTRDLEMTEELLSQKQQMEVMQERQNTEAYKSARFPCTLCYISFTEEKAFNNHKLKHDPISGEYICDICKLRCKTRHLLRRHITELHMKRYSCRNCQSVFYNRSSAVKHNAWHKGVVYTCNICGASFNRNTTYQSHLRLKHPSEHVCNQCGEPFHSKKGLLCHINLTHKLKRDTVASGGDHETSGPYCAECDIQFTCKQAWTRHILISPKHQHERHICALGCDTCGETLPDKESLRAHRISHRPIKSITCEECGEVMKTHNAYDAHFRRAHPDKTRKHCPAKTQKHYPNMQVPCMCEVCGKVFNYKGALKVHSYNHTGERPFRCDLCSKRFSTRGKLSIHGRTHTKELPHKCDICGRGFPNSSNLNRHKKVHTNAKPYECDICAKSFKCLGTVKAHIEYVHMKKPWPKRDRSKRQKRNERRSRGDKRTLL